MKGLHDYNKFQYLKGISGIYCFINTTNQKKYIGRSKDIYMRIGEHFRNSNNIKNNNYHCHFYNALRKYDYNVWDVQCLYQTYDYKEMIQLETYYIKYYDSVKKGYNSTYKTDSPPVKKGSKNTNAKLNEQDVYNIREDYKNILDPQKAYEKYKQKTSFANFINIWNGYRWNYIHMDVYTEENKQLHKLRSEYRHIYETDTYKKTRDCVIPIRQLYVEEKLTVDEVYNMFDFLNRNTFNDIWYGNSFIDLVPPGYLEVKQNGRKHYKTLLHERVIEKMPKTIFENIQDDWKLVKNACRTTVRKQFSEKQPTDNFKKAMLISEHSPIRLLSFYWKWKDIPYDIAMHWARHKFEKFISTQRNDRQKEYDRDAARQDIPVIFDGHANMQNLIDAWRKRLCFQAEKRTREYAEDFKYKLHKTHPFEANVLVPNCVYRCGCPEMNSCKFWQKFQEPMTREELINIQSRYDIYNKQFYEKMENKYDNN